MDFLRFLLYISLSLLPFITSAQTASENNNTESVNKPKIVAHRGYWNCEEAGYTKNSIASLRCAQEHGFWGSEFDVNITSDSVLVIYHDKAIKGKRLSKHPYEKFKDFRLANGEPLPTIDDYLEQAKKSETTVLIYEMKAQNSEELEELIVSLSIKKLKEYDLLHPNRVAFVSFSIGICEKLATLLPEFSVQFLGLRSPAFLSALGINGVDYNHNLLSVHPNWFKQARERNMTINVWTINNDHLMTKFIDLGVDFITTDYPLRAQEFINTK